MKNIFLITSVLLLTQVCHAQVPSSPQPDYETQALEVTQYIQQTFYLNSDGLYASAAGKTAPDFMWGNGIMFSALIGASRYQPETYLPLMSRFFSAMDRYWDSKSPVPGYEPAPTAGNGHDKYYDDNEWMVLTFLEAYDLTHEQKYLQRARAALKFSLSGWDDQLGGGILWHQTNTGKTKNTCSNAPAATACLRMAKYLPADESKRAITMAGKIVDWTNSQFETDDGLYQDSESIIDQKKNPAKLTYNTALMIRADLGLYRWTGNQKYLNQAKRSSKAADWFTDRKTGAYRDSIKWSHLQVEADLEMYRATKDEYLLKRARQNADFFYNSWKSKPPESLIDNASIARLLWLMADTQSKVGQDFWLHFDAVR